MINDAQPNPIKNDLPACWDLVINDMKERDKTGLEKYGVRLQPNNGRVALIDAYQESLDLVVYLRQAIYEIEELKKGIKEEADYCYSHAMDHDGTVRGIRHKERGDRLMRLIK